nr:hypothetical protein CFP56_63947 [Quercus suber]
MYLRLAYEVCSKHLPLQQYALREHHMYHRVVSTIAQRTPRPHCKLVYCEPVLQGKRKTFLDSASMAGNLYSLLFTRNSPRTLCRMRISGSDERRGEFRNEWLIAPITSTSRRSESNLTNLLGHPVPQICSKVAAKPSSH